jgi:hypothetical protein
MHTHRQRLPHFDHAVDILRAEVGPQPHGLLGQTASFTKPVKAVDHQGTGVIEGKLEDYEVNNVHSVHSKFNRYGVKAGSEAVDSATTASMSSWSAAWFKHEIIPHGTLKADGNPVKPAQRTSTFFVTPFTDLKVKPLKSGKTFKWIEHPDFTYSAKMSSVDGFAGSTLAVESISITFTSGQTVSYNAASNNLTVNGRALDAGESAVVAEVNGKTYSAQKIRVKNGGAIIELPGMKVYLRVDLIKGIRLGQQMEQTDAEDMKLMNGALGRIMREGGRNGVEITE